MSSTTNQKCPSSTRLNCENCRRKIHFAVPCRCEMSLCMVCRFPDEHKCSYDYVVKGAESIRTANPVVVKDKVSKI